MIVIAGVGVLMWVLGFFLFVAAISGFKSDNGSASGAVGSIIGLLLMIASLVLFVLGGLLFISALFGNA
jgi:hypothetical protein